MVSALSRANLIAIWARGLVGTPARLVVSEQNTLSEWAGQNRFHLAKRVTPLLARLSYRWATRVGAVSRGVADDLVDVCRIPGENIEVIYNPAATPAVLDKARQPLEHPWFAPDQPPVLVAAGRLSPEKDYENLLHAVALVRKKKAVRLIILGEGDERASLQELVHGLDLQDDVLLPGFAENPYQYISRAAVFVLSSRFEGLPTVLIEALCCGVPIVATDCPSGPREILDGGRYGLLVPVGESDQLAEAIERTLLGQGPTPQEVSWQAYTVDRIVNHYLSLLFDAPN